MPGIAIADGSDEVLDQAIPGVCMRSVEGENGSLPQRPGCEPSRRWHQPTIAYVARRTSEGLSKREIIRCLKRYPAREIYHLLPPTAAVEHPVPIPAKMAA
jgi:hypothetical protein